jgi:catechol 2,3-dioxygenase-like lactoylglutathione lyase family enzyme
MIGDKDAIATIAVKDIEVARKFYSDVLGLKPLPHAEPEVLNYKSGNASVIVYKSQYAGTNKATAANWHVDDVEKEARDLKSKGVAFEHYDIPGLTAKGDVYVADKFKTAWFKDPDGNILSIIGS